MANNPNTDPWSWYTEIPVVSRVVESAAVVRNVSKYPIRHRRGGLNKEVIAGKFTCFA